MRTISTATLTLAVLLATSTMGFAQVKIVNVDVQHSGGDSVGTQLAAAVRTELVRTGRYAIDESSPMEIRIMSLDLWNSDSGRQHNASAVSYNVLLLTADQRYVYVTSGLYTVGRNKVDFIARDLVAEFDSAAVSMRRKLLSALPTADPDMVER